MARAILEGICYEIKVNMECMARYLPAPSSIVLSGGLTKCPSLAPSLAGILGTPVTQYSNPESTALGAWMSAAVATGLYPGWEEAFQAAPGLRCRYTDTPGKQGQLQKRIQSVSGILFQTVSLHLNILLSVLTCQSVTWPFNMVTLSFSSLDVTASSASSSVTIWVI